jgi:hypothetical protein
MIEIVWMTIAFLALLVAVWGWLDANAGVQRMKGRAVTLQIIATGYRRGETFAIAKALVLIGLGVPATLSPEPTRWSPFVAALMLLSVMILLNSALHFRDRLNVRRELYRPPGGTP